MSDSRGKVQPTRVVDKNGRETTVRKRVGDEIRYGRDLPTAPTRDAFGIVDREYDERQDMIIKRGYDDRQDMLAAEGDYIHSKMEKMFRDSNADINDSEFSEKKLLTEVDSTNDDKIIYWDEISAFPYPKTTKGERFRP